MGVNALRCKFTFPIKIKIKCFFSFLQYLHVLVRLCETITIRSGYENDIEFNNNFSDSLCVITHLLTNHYCLFS